MRWQTTKPQPGDRRMVKRFAWLPEQVWDEQGQRWQVWLEYYLVEQEYQAGYRFYFKALAPAHRWQTIKHWIYKL